MRIRNSEAPLTLPSPKICKRIRQLYNMMDSPNPNEAASARDKLDKLRAKYGLRWVDVHGCINAANADDNGGATSGNTSHPGTVAPQGPAAGPKVNVLNLVLRLLEKYVATTAAERLAIALYALFTHVAFKYFSTAPRLGVLSPVEVSGKTSLLKLLEQLVFRPYRTDNATAAAIYRQLYFGGEQTLLLDEGDNTLRATLNSGYDFGGKVTRTIDGRPRAFLTFGPLVIAGSFRSRF
jgi:hypothetical protein